MSSFVIQMFGTERLDTHSFGMEFQNTIELWYRTAIVASRSNHQRFFSCLLHLYLCASIFGAIWNVRNATSLLWGNLL